MIKSGLIAAMAFSLIFEFAATAMASDVQNAREHHYKRHANAAAPHYSAYGDPNLPVENALRWGYSQGYSNYPSGFGGLYGDGRYPGNTVSNYHTYNTLR